MNNENKKVMKEKTNVETSINYLPISEIRSNTIILKDVRIIQDRLCSMTMLECEAVSSTIPEKLETLNDVYFEDNPHVVKCKTFVLQSLGSLIDAVEVSDRLEFIQETRNIIDTLSCEITLLLTNENNDTIDIREGHIVSGTSCNFSEFRTVNAIMSVSGSMTVPGPLLLNGHASILNRGVYIEDLYFIDTFLHNISISNAGVRLTSETYSLDDLEIDSGHIITGEPQPITEFEIPTEMEAYIPSPANISTGLQNEITTSNLNIQSTTDFDDLDDINFDGGHIVKDDD